MSATENTESNPTFLTTAYGTIPIIDDIDVIRALLEQEQSESSMRECAVLVNEDEQCTFSQSEHSAPRSSSLSENSINNSTFSGCPAHAVHTNNSSSSPSMKSDEATKS